ncbi:MAG: carbonic anhydrase family protein [Rubrivivax sp.]|nr:carbonic anhydrase family protein [Rubrivivax sp.]
MRRAVRTILLCALLGALPHGQARAADAAAGPVGEPADPLEQLRQRLAERLNNARTVTRGSPYDLQVVGRSPVAAAAPAAAAPRPAPARPPARSADPDAWAYAGATGPQAWASLSPEYAQCAKGQRQSPIDLQGGFAVDLAPVGFDYRASAFTVADTGRFVRVAVAPGNHIELGGRRYELQGFTFHRPGEGRIDGRAFAMSLHLLHRDAEGRLAVVALLLDRGPAQPAVQQVLNHLPLERGSEQAARVTLDLAALLPADRRYYTYMGSLSTPPCTEGVQWVVMRQPVTLSPEQLEIFARLYPQNARPLQAAHERRILQSN